eukprot:scaffold178521_cov18-Tisochrysis_lutea.AAC.1
MPPALPEPWLYESTGPICLPNRLHRQTPHRRCGGTALISTSDARQFGAPMFSTMCALDDRSTRKPNTKPPTQKPVQAASWGSEKT